MFPYLYHKKGPGKFESRLYNPSPLKNIMTNFFVRRDFLCDLFTRRQEVNCPGPPNTPLASNNIPQICFPSHTGLARWPGGRGTERGHSVKLQLSFHFWFNIWVERWMHVCERKQERIVWLFKAVSKNTKIYLGWSNFELFEAICK